MKLVIGLGNPGILYKGTRHNVGFLVIDALAKEEGIILKRERGAPVLSGRSPSGAQIELILAKPRTYMNLSGQAVYFLKKKYGLGPADILIVCDDLDLDFGMLRIRQKGSSGGHRGLDSVFSCLDSQDIPRLRIGIGRPRIQGAAADYVLARFNRQERAGLGALIDRARQCCQSWALKGISQTMNDFNSKEQR